DSSRNKKYGGAGLGLALVKQVADAHGAELVIESEVGVGTVVRVVTAVDG
ncbi:MAG: ATP-binding protein, partial [Oscillospiraceae bacterium]|nr:ATP-binding protein [Oscillospiraceae bacterium]